MRITRQISILIIRAIGRRFANSAVSALVLPGIDHELIFFSLEVVIPTGDCIGSALGTLADVLNVSGHLASSR